MNYLAWREITITDFSDQTINNLYGQGFLFTRIQKGLLKQTRSLRINLAKFALSSENRRVLRKTESVVLQTQSLPYRNYHWSIGKLGKDFYTQKFGDGTFSANKIKELTTEPERSNFNTLFIYTSREDTAKPIGYCIALVTNDLVHYSYPFYDLATVMPNLGLGMMLQTILYAKEQGKKYIYLGSAQRPSDTYKLQFAGLEWFDGGKWEDNATVLKNILSDLDKKY